MLRDQITNQLIYSTVKISCKKATASSCGTGFFMSHSINEMGDLLAIVTNKHVVEGFDSAEITLVESSDNGQPLDANHITISVNNLMKEWIPHPDPEIDVCLIPISKYIEECASKTGKQPYFRSISTKMTLTPTDAESLTAIEDVIMIGYPIGIIDEYNNKPVVRKGITATSLNLNYENKPDFLIDIACFRGSSGSPVFLKKEGLSKEQTSSGIQIGILPSYSLLGILHSTYTLKKDGDVIIRNIPTTKKPIVELETYLNLGHVTKAERIVELFTALEKSYIK